MKTKTPFKIKGKTYRIIEGLFVDELQVKERNGRYATLNYVSGLEDALNVINKKPRKLKQ